MADAVASGGRLPFEAYVEAGTRRGVRWTGLRNDVLDLAWSSPGPIGAYDAAVRLTRGGRKGHPTSVYRCFQRLEEAELLIPVLTWKRYLLSPDPAVRLWGLLLCGGCGDCTPVDLSAELDGLRQRARRTGFRPRSYAVECVGLCLRCSAPPGTR